MSARTESLKTIKNHDPNRYEILSQKLRVSELNGLLLDAREKLRQMEIDEARQQGVRESHKPKPKHRRKS